MAALNFPNSPSTNDLHTENGVTFKWNGTIWKRVSSAYTDATNLNVTGISTFAGNINANGNIVGDNSTNISGINDVLATSLYTSDYIIHRGESGDNTKIRFPADDTITAETNGSERLRITSAGLIGIGEASPTYQTEVKVTDTSAYSSSSIATSQNQLRVNNAGASGVAGILLTAEPSSGSAGHASIRTIAPSSGSADLIFSTRNSSTFGEKLRIASGGDVTTTGAAFNRANAGITARAGDSFNVTRASGTPLELNRTGSDGTLINLFNDGTHKGTIGITASDMWFGTTAERMRITSGGSLIVGNQTSTSYKLCVSEAAHTRVEVISTSNNSAGAWFKVYNSGTLTSQSTIRTSGGSLQVYTGTTSEAERLRLDSSGRLIIGDTDTDNAFSGGDSLIIGNTTSGTRSGITLVSHSAQDGGVYFSRGTSSNSDYVRGQLVYNHSNDYFAIYTSGAAIRFKIGSGGGHSIFNDTGYYAGNLTECNSDHLPLNIRKTRNGQTKGIAFGPIGAASLTTIQAYDTSDNSANALTLNPFGGDVLIGNTTVTSETGKLDIYHAADDDINNPHIRLHGASGNDPRIEFGTPTNSGEGGYIMYNDSDEGLYIGSRMGTYSEVNLCTGMNDGSPSSNARLTVNASGHITTPQQPVFHVQLEGHKNADQNPLKFTDIRVNNGSHYNSSTGRFTAPCSGMYFFFMEGIKNSNTNQVTRVYIQKNGSYIYDSYHLRIQEEGAYANGCTNWIVQLSTNDYITVRLSQGGLHAGEYTHFGGYLIG